MFRSKLPRCKTYECEQIMPTPVVLVHSLPCTIPTPICTIPPPLFPYPEEKPDPTIIPISIDTWPTNYHPPTGTFLQKEVGTVPDGYFACDGAAVSRTEYSRLFSVIGTYYGEGDQSTTFNLPILTNDSNPYVMYIIKYAP